MRNKSSTSQLRSRITIVMAVLILIPSLYGFGSKFIEFIAVFREDADGAFAVAPILNYLLAACGFSALFLWGMINGMFRDVEGPKYTLLETEERLERQSRS